MKTKSYLIFPVLVICLMWVIGCSGGRSPVTPNNQPGEKAIGMENLPVGVTDALPDGTPSAGMGALGLFNLHINPSLLTAEIASLRDSTSTDTLEVVDITNFLRMAPCSNCVKIRNVSLDPDGNIVVSIGIKHPFPAGDPMKPITGRNRADLHVFNIEGTIVSNIPGTSFAGIGATSAGFQLVNADGYTGYLDTVLDNIYPTTATIHPYILHFDDYTKGNFDPGNVMGFANVTDPPPTGNLVMAMGCDYNFQDYAFKIDPATPVDFIYAVGCTYAISAESKSQRFTPEYRIPQHNKKAASEVTVAIVNNNLKGEIPTSTAGIEIRVVDVSHGIAVGMGLDQMFSDSSVDSIMIDIPGVMTTPLTIPGGSPVSGTGQNPSDPLLYTGTITNTASGVEGSYVGLVKVRDTYTPGQNGSPLLNAMDGIQRVDPLETPTSGLFAINEFATYQTFTVNVASGIFLTVTSINPTEADQHTVVTGAVIGGTGFINVTSVRLEMDAAVIPAADYVVDTQDQITADFDLTSADIGLYDVVVEVQGGETAKLEDGFEVLLKCGTESPEFDYVYTLNPTIDTNWVCAILNAGPYAGYTLYSQNNVSYGGYKVFNHMTQTDDTPVISWGAFQAGGNPLLMEPANNNGLMIIRSAYYGFQVVDQTTGTVKQTLSYSGYITIMVGDFDSNDDFWCIANTRPNSSIPNVYEYYLLHYIYNPSSPSSPYSLTSTTDVTSLFRDNNGTDMAWEVFGDMVMLPGTSYCFVLTGYQGADDHKVDKVDLSGTPTIVASYSFAGEGLNNDAQIDIAQSRAVKMELDTSNSDYMPCRLVIAGSRMVSSQYYMNLYRLDTDLNLINKSTKAYNITSGSYTRKFYGMALDMDNRVVCHLTEMIWTDPKAYYGISKLPADW